MTVLACLTDPAVVAKIRPHLGLPQSPPPLSPARLDPQVELFDNDLPVDQGLEPRDVTDPKAALGNNLITAASGGWGIDSVVLV